MPRAAILGSGPAGLFAAYACSLSGIEPVLFSQGRISRLYGAQFLAKPLPFFGPILAQNVRVTLQGTEDEYRRKVYGEDYTGPVSPLDYVGHHTIYDIRYVYTFLWEKYANSIFATQFTARNYGDITAQLAEDFDFVFSSIPIKDMCVVREHNFEARTIYAIGDAPDLNIRCPVRVIDNSIVYCGDRNSSWYRAANIFGHCTVEWSKKHPISNVATVTKPLSTDCTCHPNVVRIGRYGEWRKGVLSLDAFNKTMNTIRNGVQSALF